MYIKVDVASFTFIKKLLAERSQGMSPVPPEDTEALVLSLYCLLSFERPGPRRGDVVK
jgi:hypothetical protein